MIIELFTILLKTFSIYSLGFLLANLTKIPTKKEIKFGLEHSFSGLLALIFISWSSYLIFNNALLNFQYYLYIFFTIFLLTRFKSSILKQYLQLFVIVSTLFFIVNFFELNTSTNDSIAYFLTEGLDFKNKQFSLLLDFRSIPLIIISRYFDIININYVAIVPGLVNTLGLISIHSYLKMNKFYLQNDIFSTIFRFILLFSPVLIFHFFYLNVHFLFGILLTFILLHQSQNNEFNSIAYVIALSVFFILRYEALLLFLLFSFFFSKDKLHKNRIIFKNIIISNIILSITWIEIFSNASTNTRGIGQVPESFISILIYQFVFFVIYYILIYKLDNIYIYRTLQIIFVLLVGLFLYLIGEHMTIFNMFNPSGIWSITPLIFVVVIFYNILKDFYNVITLSMLFIWLLFALVQTPQLFSGLDNFITDQIYYFLDNFFGTHTNNESICRDYKKSSACQRTVIHILIPMYYFSQYDLLMRNKT